MVQQIFLTASIAANTTSDVTPTQIRTSNARRRLAQIGINGATVNTALLNVRVNGVQITNSGISNGVTRTAGAAVDQVSDVIPIDYIINPNEILEILVSNTTGGALTFYVAYDIESEEDAG